MENGFIRIANELFDAILAGPITSQEMSVLLSIVRKTYGYGKKQDDVSASQLGKLCNMSRPHVTEALNSLARKNIINKQPGIHGSIISIQKDYSQWREDPLKGQKRTPHAALDGYHYTYRVTHEATGEFYIGVRTSKCQPTQDRYIGSGRWPADTDKQRLVKTITGQFQSREEAHAAEQQQIQTAAGNPLLKNLVLFNAAALATRTDSVQGVHNLTIPSSEPVQVDRTESVHTIDNVPIDNQQKTKTSPASPSAMLARFDVFWAAWPKKDEKKDAKALFLKIAPDDAKLQLMLNAIAKTKASGKWDEKRFIVSPVKWLRGERWSDEVMAGYTDQQSNVIAKFNEILGDLAGDADDGNFRESRASAIDAFLTFDKHPERGDYAARYFGHIRKTAVLPWKSWVSFDWLISRDGHGKVLERVLEKQ